MAKDVKNIRTWQPHGKLASTLIQANKHGTADTQTVLIKCNFEGTPEDIRRFIKSIQRAVAWVESSSQNKGDDDE